MPKIPSPRANVNDLEDAELEPLEPETLVVENEALRKGFTVIPNYILRNKNISIGARMTYTVLLSYAWQEGSCFPGQKRLARDLGIKDRMVRYYLSELKKQGFVETKRRGLGKTNVYVLKDIRSAEWQNIATQERQSISDQERQNIADKEDTELQNSDNTRGENTAEDVVAFLDEVGIEEKVSQRLIKHFSLERIREKVDYLCYLREHRPKEVSSPAGWLRKAIEEDYAPPAGYKSKEEREAEVAAREKRRRETDQEIAAQEQRSRPAQSWQEWVIENQKLSDNLVAITDQLREALRQALPETTYNTWATQLLVVELSDATVRVAVPSQAARNNLIDHRALFDTSLTQLLGHPIVTSLEVFKQPLER